MDSKLIENKGENRNGDNYRTRIFMVHIIALVSAYKVVVVTVDCACGLDGRNEKDCYIILREKHKLNFKK
jgi:hypothetical protein